jgi:hypothetical protein
MVARIFLVTPYHSGKKIYQMTTNDTKRQKIIPNGRKILPYQRERTNLPACAREFTATATATATYTFFCNFTIFKLRSTTEQMPALV